MFQVIQEKNKASVLTGTNGNEQNQLKKLRIAIVPCHFCYDGHRNAASVTSLGAGGLIAGSASTNPPQWASVTPATLTEKSRLLVFNHALLQ